MQQRRTPIADLALFREMAAETIDQMPLGFVALDHAMCATYANPMALTLTGASLDALVGRRPWDLFPEIVGTQHQTVRASAPITIEVEEHFAPSDRWAAVLACPTQTGTSIFLRDISGQKRAEETVRRSVALLHGSLDTMLDACMVCSAERDAQGAIVSFRVEFANVVASTYLGGPPDTLMGKPIPDWKINPRDMPFLDACRRVVETGDPWAVDALAYAIAGPDGTSMPGALSLLVARFSDGFFATWRDITERHRAERSMRHLSTAIEQASDAVVITDATGAIEYINPAFERVTGYSAAEVLGQNPRILKSGVQGPAFYAAMWATLTSGQPFVGEMTNKRKDGSLFEEEAVISPIRDEAGTITSFVAVKRDITERTAAEADRTRLEGLLAQAQKMESVGRLAGGVAHDFNNMLGAILGNAELALAALEPGHPVYADLLEIQRAAQRSADLTGQLLAFARRQTVTPRVLDLNETLGGMLVMLRRLIGEGIELAWKPAGELWPIRVDPSQLDQILVNLVVNSRDAIETVGLITIETARGTLEPDYCATHLGAVPGEYVVLTVRDTGCGMDAETMSHLFEPFFTTKETGRGTGLGLATVYGIVKQNEGFINAYSEPGIGSTLRVYLPRHRGRAAVLEEPTQAVAGSGGETVLLVEDEPAILRVGTVMLERLGYRVIAAATPGAAIRLAREHVGEIHLLMTDVVMPEMNGRALARNLLSIYPHMGRLFMSGYTADVIADHGVLDPGVHFLQKPFSTNGLAAKVREALDQGPASADSSAS